MKNKSRLSVCEKKTVYLLSMALLSYGLLKMAVVDWYIVATPSMAPSIQPGQRIAVNKLLYGARIVIGSERSNRKHVFRLPGLRKIAPDDIVMFNMPMDKWSHTISFKQDEVYCKRILGTPGDRIGTVDGHCWNDRSLRPVGSVAEQEKLRWMFDSLFIMMDCYDVIPLVHHKWNIKNWGPLTVPAKGLTLSLDEFSKELYREVIEYETGIPLDEDVTEYTFQGDYYFALGDNSMDSFDSRYWGFIPDDFIIGICIGPN